MAAALPQDLINLTCYKKDEIMNAAHMELLIDKMRLKYGRNISIRTLETLNNPLLTSAVRFNLNLNAHVTTVYLALQPFPSYS